MSFEAYGSSQSESSNKKDVDWSAMNKYVVETADLQEKSTISGYVVGIVDLGTQEQPDSENPFTGTSEDEAKLIAEKPATYFKDGIDPNTKKSCRLICWPNKPIQSVAVAVEFPDIMIDKGQFFGESNPQPLRMWLGDTFYIEGSGMVVARPTPLRVNTKLGDWSFDVKHLFYKMAVSSKIIKQGECFVPNDIDKLLGKAFLFSAQIFMRKGKDNKEYFTEKVAFSSGLMKGQATPEIVNEPFMVQFNRINQKDDLKQLRNHVINTIKRAKNYEGSAIQKQLEEGKDQDQQESAPTPAPVRTEAKTKPKAKTPAPVDDLDDPDLPF
jgi:hypothetical protein